MKRYVPIILSAALFAGAGVSAFGQSKEVRDACSAVEMLAPLVMQQRQSGAAIDEILPYADLAQGPVRALVQDMIRDAYNTPQASGQSAQSAVSAFQQRWVADCFASYE